MLEKDQAMEKFSPLLLVFLLVLCACRKDKKTSPADCRTATMIVNSGAATSIYSFSYNNEGKLSRLVSKQDEVVFDYTGNGYVITYLTSGKMRQQTTVKTDAQQRPTEALIKLFKADGTFDSEVITCEYNAKGELVKQVSQKDKQPAVTTATVWADGNCTAISNNTQSLTLEYYTDRPVQPADIFRINQLLIQGFVNVFNRNLAKSLKSGATITQYSYTFDADGRVITATAVTGASTETRAFQYSCD
ncbi:hypothetical protein EGT74_13500 [Chitinophaga lutea]|uniref:DUF4595 domain-containing protein n=2 Tax=Chitinophaga lutea TaxID=2488634 RepID=A0A3N4PSU2_9BACT|nr:hypothetical protein EGT74_13500 [Chitinophaga lutea]